MTAADAAQSIEEALVKSNLSKNQMPKQLSDNGSSYVAFDFKMYIESHELNPDMAVLGIHYLRARLNAITAP